MQRSVAAVSNLCLNMWTMGVCVQLHPLYLSDLLTHQRKEPDVKQHLAGRGHDLEVDHQHHRKQEEEGEVRHNIPVKLDLRRAVQGDQPRARRFSFKYTS